MWKSVNVMYFMYMPTKQLATKQSVLSLFPAEILSGMEMHREIQLLCLCIRLSQATNPPN